MIVAVHQASATPDPIGVTKNGLVYEIFFTSAPKEAFTPVEVLHLAFPIEAHLKPYWLDAGSGAGP